MPITSCRWPDNAPSVTLHPGDTVELSCCADWPPAGILRIPLRFEADCHTVLWLSFFARNEENHRLFVQFAFLPGIDTELRFDLAHLDGQTLFMPRHPGMLKGTCLGRRILAAEIARITLTLHHPERKQVLTLGPASVDDAPPQVCINSVPLSDEFGQWTRRDWPGKTATLEELTARLTAELAQPPVRDPGTDRSPFGGHRSHRFEATGFFHTHHDGRRWWLVDPEGCGFWSTGVDCVNAGSAGCIVPGTEGLYASLPGLGTDGSGRTSANWAQHNLDRVFGADWPDAWARLTSSRLRKWGFNTVANWSDLEYARRSKLPYVIPLRDFPTTELKLFRDLPDIFDPAYAAAAAGFAAQLEPFRDDPYLIGWFLTNEPKWGFGDFLLASEMLEANPGSHTRQALVDFLRERYGDELAWQRAWKRPDLSFDDLTAKTHHRLADAGGRIAGDLEDFTGIMIDRWIDPPLAACRSVDPHHLHLGLRFAWIAHERFYRIARRCDVFSMNCYGMEPPLEAADALLKHCDRPMLIGEFHFGALDVGLLGSGLRGVADQAQRGVAYRRYVELAAAHPAIVGTHYFQYNDQHCLGRHDGECWNIGLVDVCHRPYTQMVDAVRETNRDIYTVVTGERLPTTVEAVETAKFGL